MSYHKIPSFNYRIYNKDIDRTKLLKVGLERQRLQQLRGIVRMDEIPEPIHLHQKVLTKDRCSIIIKPYG